MHPETKAMIDHYQFERIPVEGTLFISTYRSKEEVVGGGPVGTAIIAMYTNDPLSISLFHKLPVDEIWHFYGGDPMRLILMYPDGSSEDVIMGPDPSQGQHVQWVIPGGVWQAGHLLEGGRYALFGCTMAPGFTDEMFTGGTKEDLLAIYPDRQEDINRFACGGPTRMPEGFAT